MTRSLRRNRERSRGQALVEFALILPVFLALTLGVVDGARLFSVYISLTNASREGALYASADTNYLNWCTATSPRVACPTGWSASNQTTDPDNIAARVADEMAGVAGINYANITLSPPTCDNGTCNASSVKINVTVTYSMALSIGFIPGVGALFGNPVRMTSTTWATIQ
jgi:Flp pilus assembly protein TadG